MPSSGPRICTGAASPPAEKILPIGAPLKYGSVAPETWAMPAVVDGKLPTCAKSFACCSGAVEPGDQLRRPPPCAGSPRGWPGRSRPSCRPAAGQGGDVPLARARVTGLALDVADHPGRAGDRGEAAGAEARVPAGVDELLELGGEPGRPAPAAVSNACFTAGLVGVDELARRVVVDLLLGGDDRVVEPARGVHPRGARRGGGLELLAEGEVVVPGRHLRRRAAAGSVGSPACSSRSLR